LRPNFINIKELSFEKSSHLGVLKKVIYSNLDLLSATTQVAYTELKEGIEVEEHSHDSMEEVFLVLEGKCEFYLNGNVHILNKESVIKVPPKIKHKIKAITHLKLFYFGIKIL
jgi:quercetin dioxygenase-like cupin family protein